MEEVTYKLKTDREVRVGQMKRDLSFGMTTLATVHGIYQKGIIMKVETSVRRLLQNSKQEVMVGDSKKNTELDNFRGRICKIWL